MKKTLLVTLDFYPSVGGIASYWKHLGACMPPNEWVVLAPPLPLNVRELQTPYRICRKSFFSRLCNPHWLPLVLQVYNIVKKEKIEIVVVSHILPVGTVLFFLHFIIKIPYIIVGHGMDASLPLNNSWKKNLCSLILKSAQTIIANSKKTAENFEKLGGQKEKICIIYPCPSLDQEKNLKNSAHSEEVLEKVKDKKVLLSVSRLVERKGHAYVLDALQNIRMMHPDCVYVIVGDGSYRAALERKVSELELNDCVFFCNELQGDDICKWYDRCDVFILTPYELSNRDTEGFGMVYVEANLFEKPAIGSRCGGVPDAVIDGVTGILVDQKNSSQIANAVGRLLDDPLYAGELGVNGKRRVEREFLWEQAAEKYKKILA